MSVTHLDALDIAAFLERQQTGVLALARDDDAYAVPVSYAYDEEGPALYFRLGYTADSQKRAFLEATAQVSFVVYGESADGWTSVVAIGPVEEVAETDLDTTVAEAMAALEIPYFTVHEDASDLEFHLLRLDVETLSGIREG
jgi:nitroimidazol reductase NimA-like FMN-containing flavoprotein (pyridoxamine 5'-phosphate oxidase superfamily)